MPTASYWCYRCTRVIRITDTHTSATCPRCSGGFIEAVDAHAPPDPILRRRHRRHHAADWAPFNPVIVLRPIDASDRGFEFFYDDGTSSGLQPLPEMMSEFLMESGFERLLEQLSQIDLNGISRSEYSPASKSAIESLRKIELNSLHVTTECTDSVCAICIEELNLVDDLSEMPCKHIYHSECIVKWLNMRNTCPVCRYELPKESLDLPESEAIELNELNNSNELNNVESSEGDQMAVGLTIWRLPGGGFAVGRFSGGRRTGGGEQERELPVVITEGEGVFTDRRVRYRESGIGRVFRNVVSVFGRLRGSGGGGASVRSSLSPGGVMMNRSRSLSIFGRMRSRRRGDWNLEEQNGMARL